MMKKKKLALLAVLAMVLGSTVLAQGLDNGRPSDYADVSIGRGRSPVEFSGLMPHPYHVEARHWPAGCEAAKALFDAFEAVPISGGKCGELFYVYDGENLITSAGQTLISDLLGKVSSIPANANYVALTNTAITPAVADTTLSGEIVSNGLSRAQGTYADLSAAIGTPPTPSTPTIVGTTGAATLYYWVFACTPQGCTAVGSSSNTTTANATLTTGNYVSVAFTGKVGASYYNVVRTQGSGAPSGSIAGGSTQASTGLVSNTPFCSVPVAGSAPTCTILDQSNTVTAWTVPASDQTFYGKYTISKTFTASGTQSAQAFGIFNASSSGTLLAEGTFTSASLITNDTLAFTWTNYH